MRVFFGLELEQESTLAIADWRDQRLTCSGKAVPPANFHITLAFLGEIDNPTLERLCLSVDEWLGNGSVSVSGTNFELDRVGYWQKPGIYWLGCSTCPQQLGLLADKLKGLAASVGLKQDKKTFQPHVTLYRRCSGAPLAPPTVPSIAVSFSHFALLESIQGKRGVSYRALQEWELAAAHC